LDWSCRFNRKELRCTRESIAVNGCQVLKVEDGYFSVSAEGVPSPQKQMLHEDAGNLSSVLHYLMTEKREAFDELMVHLRTAVPGFRGLNVKARGGLGK
jgi:hypothetical protein